MVVVQTIRISWTKNSRGGALAESRNRVPKSFRIPNPAGSGEIIWHHKLITEEKSFDQTDPGIVRLHVPNERFGTRCAEIAVDHNSAKLTYRWRDGAPPRTFMNDAGDYVPVTRTIKITSGDWASIEYNGRFSGDDSGIWWYEQEIVNLGVMLHFSPDFFVRNEPIERYCQLAKLW